MNDTPETHAFQQTEYCAYASMWRRFAQKLERERDRCQEQADALLLRLGATQERMIDAERERDILRKHISIRDISHKTANDEYFKLAVENENLERERDEAKDNVRKLAVSLADSIRFSLSRQDETEQAMDECNELRILVDGLLEMNQKLFDERNSYYNELLTKKGLCKVQEQVITDWKLEAEKWRAIANDNRNRRW